MPGPAPRDRFSATALAVVLGLHLLGLGLAGRLAVWRDRAPTLPARAPLVVQLLWPRNDAPPAADARAAAPTATPAATPRRARAAEASEAPAAPAAAPQAITLPAAPAATVPAEGAQAVAPPPLILTLPQGASAAWRRRSPALDDARSNSGQRSLEARLADAMGGNGRWTVERIDNDRIRYRRGSECIEAQRTRAGQLDLAGGAFRNLWAGKKC